MKFIITGAVRLHMSPDPSTQTSLMEAVEVDLQSNESSVDAQFFTKSGTFSEKAFQVLIQSMTHGLASALRGAELAGFIDLEAAKYRALAELEKALGTEGETRSDIHSFLRRSR